MVMQSAHAHCDPFEMGFRTQTMRHNKDVKWLSKPESIDDFWIQTIILIPMRIFFHLLILTPMAK